jgi:hypothetical protein
VLPKASPGLAAAWWLGLLLLGILPGAFAVSMGILTGAVRSGQSLIAPLAFAGSIFFLLQVLNPIHRRAGVILSGAWFAIRYLLCESGVWRDRNAPRYKERNATPSTLTAWQWIRR